MAAAAQLARELASLNDAHGIAVFLAKQAVTPDSRAASSEVSYVLMGTAFMICSFATRSTSANCSGVTPSKWVKSKRRRSGPTSASLLHMVTQNLAQRCMEQMRAGMVARNALATKLVDNCTNGIAHVKLAFNDFHVVAGKALFGGLRIDDFSLKPSPSITPVSPTSPPISA